MVWTLHCEVIDNLSVCSAVECGVCIPDIGCTTPKWINFLLKNYISTPILSIRCKLDPCSFTLSLAILQQLQVNLLTSLRFLHTLILYAWREIAHAYSFNCIRTHEIHRAGVLHVIL